MITVLCWRWKAPWRYRSNFTPATVLALKRMVADHYPHRHRFVCVTDDPRGLDGVDTFPIWRDHIAITPPEGMRWPSCYVRLRAFSDEARAWWGDRYVSLDLDTVITGDLTPLFERREDFVIWNETDWPETQHYNASIWLHTPGTRTQVWDTFDPKRSPREAYRAGGRGGDQAWISYVLGPGEAVYTPADGVLSYRRHIELAGVNGRLPAHARIVNFHGVVDPWSAPAQALPWVREYYGIVEPPAATRRSTLPPRALTEPHR
jgi:hypothetical protein